jgi:hypothetical protein
MLFSLAMRIARGRIFNITYEIRTSGSVELYSPIH